jgi:hypothetical protein
MWILPVPVQCGDRKVTMVAIAKTMFTAIKMVPDIIK